jgi:hypothetical protein
LQCFHYIQNSTDQQHRKSPQGKKKEKRKNPDLKTEEIVSYKAARRSRRPKTNNPKNTIEKKRKTKQNKRTRSTLTEYTETQASDNLSQEIGPRSGSCCNSIHRQPCCSVSHVIQLVPCREAVQRPSPSPMLVTLSRLLVALDVNE